MNKIRRPAFAPQKGFSLIEVLIGAVILATGLLALSALQGSLARNAADARIRSQVAAALESVAEADRGTSSFLGVPGAAGSVNVPGVGTLNITIQGCTYRNLTTGENVSTCANKGGTAKQPQYKRIVYGASWTDSVGASRTMTLTSVVSPRTIAGSSPLPFSTPTQGVSGQLPVVRTPNPEVDGMIPIAIGDGSDTAATNPKPNVVSGNVIRTSFEVLTYKDEGSNVVKQQRRVETAVVGCSCKNNAAPTGAQLERAQWPAYWDGIRYSIYVPNPSTTAAPGTAAAKGPVTGLTQDLLCTECCRDHHDGAGSTDVKFDAYRSGAHNHFKLVSGVLTAAAATDDYMEVCRMIRVDGFWRTAQDLDAKHFGLLATENDAKSAVPLTSAKSAYETFAIDFLRTNYFPLATAVPADTAYETAGLNAPALINISKPTASSPIDKRYLHARGLYVDKVESAAQAKINQAAASCTKTGAARVECILPFIAFTSINVTEPAFWNAAVAADLAVDSDGVILFNPTTPNRGTVNALLSAAAGSSNINTRMLKSNSGLAVRAIGIDTDDNVPNTDVQPFNIQTAGSVTGRTFTVVVSGWSGITAPPVPSVLYSTFSNTCNGSGGTYTCTVPSPYDVGAISVAIGGYNYAFSDKASVTNSSGPNNDSLAVCPDARSYFFDKNTVVTQCRNVEVSSVTSTGGAVPAGTPTLVPSIANTGKVGSSSNTWEVTTLAFSSVAEGATIRINLADEGSSIPTMASCPVTLNSSNNTGGVFSSVCP